MKKLFLKALLLLSIFYTSCSECPNDFSFNLKNNGHLNQQMSAFIDSLESNNPNSSCMFRNDSVKWWNTYSSNGISINRKTIDISGIEKYISPKISLNRIKGIHHLHIDSLYNSGDTIKGLLNIEKLYFTEDCTGFNGKDYCMDTSTIYLVIDQNGKINEIIHINLFNPDCFCMDESEITSNEYRSFDSVQEVADPDSIEFHKNDFELIEDDK